MLLFDLFALLHIYLFIVMCAFLFAIAVPSAISIVFVYMLLSDLFVLLHIYLFVVMFVHLALVLTFLSVLLHLRLVLFLGWCLFVTLHVCIFVAMLVQQDIALLCLFSTRPPFNSSSTLSKPYCSSKLCVLIHSFP